MDGEFWLPECARMEKFPRPPTELPIEFSFIIEYLIKKLYELELSSDNIKKNKKEYGIDNYPISFLIIFIFVMKG